MSRTDKPDPRLRTLDDIYEIRERERERERRERERVVPFHLPFKNLSSYGDVTIVGEGRGERAGGRERERCMGQTGCSFFLISQIIPNTVLIRLSILRLL